MTPLKRTKHPSNLRRRKRKGRGIGSGLGKTAGRGQTGQKARVKAIHPRFEGGQTPMIRHLPKFGGFSLRRKLRYHPVNLCDLGEIPAGSVVDMIYLADRSLLPKKLRRLRVKLLGDGEVSVAATFRFHAFSEQARAKVEQAGGTCEVME